MIAAASVVLAMTTVSALAATPAVEPAAREPSEVRVVGPVKNDPENETIERVLAVITALGAGFGVPFLALQVLFARNAERNTRTNGLFERYAAREFQSVASRTLSYLRIEDVDECLRKVEAYERRQHADEPCLPRARSRPFGPRASLNDLFELLSFFEDLGASYNAKDVAQRKVHNQLPTPPVQLFTEGWWFICWRRGGSHPGRRPRRWVPRRLYRRRQTELYAQFEWMVKTLRKKVPAIRAERVRHERRLILCLPPPKQRKSDAAWSVARRLSDALSAHRRGLSTLVEALERRLPAGTGDAPADAYEVVVVPPTIDESLPEAERRQYLTDRLRRCLAHLPPATVEAALAAHV